MAEDSDVLQKQIKDRFFISSGTKRSNGLITIINKKFEQIQEIYKDERILITSCKNQDHTFIIVNTYSPSDTETNKQFFLQRLNDKLNTYTADYIDRHNTHIAVLGDFNTVHLIQ